MIEQTRFLSAVFLCSEFKLENIYSGVNFCGKNFAVIFICRNFFFWIAGKTGSKNPNFDCPPWAISYLLVIRVFNLPEFLS